MESHSKKNRFYRNATHAFSAWLSMLFCLLVFCANGQIQQVRITTNVLPPYSPYIQDYPGTGNRVQVFISNLSGKDLSIRLLGKLEGDNGVLIKTSPNYRPLQALQLRATDVNRLVTRTELEGLFDLNQIEVQGMNKNELYRGLPLPEGNYQLCVQAFDNATIRPLSAEFPMGCSSLIPVRIIEPPILISPFEDEEVASKTPQTQIFTWSAPVGIMPNQVEYTLRIVELPAAEVNPNVFLDAVVLPRSGVEVKNIRGTSFLYGPQYPPLQYGKKYAWRVQAHAVNQKLNLLNDGKSPVQRFQYGILLNQPILGIEITQTPFPNPYAKTEETKLLSVNLPVNCSCQTPEPGDSKVDNKAVLKSKSATIAGFKMQLLDGVHEEKGKLVGTGMIPVPMINSGLIKLRVKLIDVQCNAQGEVIGGVVKAIYKDKVAGYVPDMDKPNAPGVELTPAQIQNMGEYFSNTKDQLISNVKNAAKSIGFELPLGLDKTIGPLQTVIAITDMTFTPTQAYFSANTWIKTPSEQINGIPLSGYNMCMSPSKPCGEGILYLADKMKLSEYFSLKGAEGSLGGIMTPDTNEVTYVQFDQDGYKKLRVHALLAPPKLVNAEAAGQPLEISINADVIDMKDWTAEFSFPKFYVQGLEEFKFSMDPSKKAIYDHSEMKTPGALPDGYETSEGQAAWQGLYLPLVNMELPSFLNKADGSSLIAGVQNLIYDDKGLSGDAFVKDAVKIGDGSMDGWYYSVDELRVSFKQSTFQTVAMKGNIVLPIFNTPENKSSQIAYTSTLSKKEGAGGFDFQLLATPTQPMQSEVLKSKITFTQSSIIASYNGTGFKVEADLSGTIDVNVGPLELPGASFEELKLGSQAPYFSLKSFKMGLASPQKEIFGLPAKLDDPKLDMTNPARPGIQFGGQITLGGDIGITAKASATLFFKIAKKGTRPDWSYDTVTPGDINVDSNLGPVALKGQLQFFDEPIHGKGLNGDFSMTVLDKITGPVKARFGAMPDYNYWYVGGEIGLDPGVSVAGPVEFQSFGGGLFSNVKKTTNAQGAIDYIPQKSNFGFEATVGMGLTTRDVLSAKATLTMAFGNGSLNSVRIDGDVWLIGAKKEDAFAKGNIIIDVDFANKIYAADMTMKAGITTPIIAIAADCSAEFFIDGKSGQWFFAMGTPEHRNNLNIEVLKIAGIEFQSYFLMGNFNRHNSVLPPLPYGLESSSKRSENTLSGLFGGKKLMLAFGAGYKIDEEFKVGPFRMSYGGALGFDVALQKFDQGCNGVVPGIYGWYTEGQIYAGFHFGLYIDVDLWVYEGTIKVMEMNAEAILKGGFINPTYFAGQVSVRYRVLNGLVKGNFNMGFKYEEEGKCIPPYTPPNPFADLPIVASISPADEKSETSILASGHADFNYPVESDLTIEIPLPTDKPEPKDIGKIYTNSDGIRIFQRVFRLKLIRKFEFDAKKPVEYANCITDDSGKLTFGRNDEYESNYNASFYRNAALIPKSDYTITVGVKVFIYNGAKLEPYIFKGTPVEHIVSAKFKTGPCIDVLQKGTGDEDLVLASYPYEGQRYFMKGESAPTFVKLRRSVQCCTDNLSANADYDLKVIIAPLEGAQFAKDNSISILSSPASFDGDQYTYQMPAGLKNKTLYRFQLIRTPKEEFVDRVLADIQKSRDNAKKITTTNNVYASAAVSYKPVSNKISNKATALASSQIDYTAVDKQYDESFDDFIKNGGATSVVDESSVKSIDIKGFKMSASNNMITEQFKQRDLVTKNLTRTLYKYYFKTSQFNTMAEKLNAAQFPPVATNQFSKLADGLTTKMVSTEGFDSYELSSEMLSDDIRRPPLILLKANGSGPWHKSVAEPIANLLGQLPIPLDKPKDKSSIFSSKEETTDAFQRAMVKFTNLYNVIEKPMENIDIMRMIGSEMKSN